MPRVFCIAKSVVLALEMFGEIFKQQPMSFSGTIFAPSLFRSKLNTFIFENVLGGFQTKTIEFFLELRLPRVFFLAKSIVLALEMFGDILKQKPLKFCWNYVCLGSFATQNQ